MSGIWGETAQPISRFSIFSAPPTLIWRYCEKSISAQEIQFNFKNVVTIRRHGVQSISKMLVLIKFFHGDPWIVVIVFLETVFCTYLSLVLDPNTHATFEPFWGHVEGVWNQQKRRNLTKCFKTHVNICFCVRKHPEGPPAGLAAFEKFALKSRKMSFGALLLQKRQKGVFCEDSDFDGLRNIFSKKICRIAWLYFRNIHLDVVNHSPEHDAS